MKKSTSLAGLVLGKNKQDEAPKKKEEAPEAEAPKATRRKGQTIRLSVDAWRQLKTLAMERECHAHDLLIEGVNMVFKKYNLPPVA